MPGYTMVIKYGSLLSIFAKLPSHYTNEQCRATISVSMRHEINPSGRIVSSKIQIKIQV